MNKNTRDNLLNALKTASEIDLVAIANEVYLNTDFEKTEVTFEFTIKQLIDAYYRIIKQFLSRLSEDDFNILPNQYTSVDIDGSSGVGHIQSRINSLLGIKDHKNLQNLANDIKWLTEYQMAFGFWDRSKTKVHDINAIKLKENNQIVEVLITKLKTEYNSITALKEQLEQSEQKLTQLVEQKNNELNTISQSLETVRNQTNDMNNFWQNGNKLDGEMKTLLESQKNALDEIKRQISLQIEDFQGLKKEVNEQKDELNKKFESADLKLVEFNQETEQIKLRKEKVLENEKKIIELLGMSADAALGGRFNARETKLGEGLTFWKIAVPLMTIVALAWVVIVFTCLSASTGNAWVDIGINLLKTTPAFILMGFVFKQYSKERNLQEEYAFKSAVAMTVTVYSELLKGGDSPENKTRQQMLLEAIRQVYASPKIHSENKDRIFSFGTKHLTEAVKNLTEVVKK